MRLVTRIIKAVLCVLSLVVVPIHASDQVFFDNGQVALRAADGGVLEPAVPIFHNGSLIGGHNHKIVEAFDNVPGTGSFPLTFVDLHANTFLRATYQKSNGLTGALGTSVVGSASFRTSAGLQFIPTVTRSDVTTNSAVRYHSQITANFGPQADLITTRTYPDPVIGKTTVDLTIDFTAQQNINLSTAGFAVGNDRFRMLTVSSMFASSTVFDADMLRYEDVNGDIQTLQLTNATARNAHLFTAPDEVGSWIELIKSPGSTWFPDSPTVRIDLTNTHGLRLGVQGFLAGTTNPNDDSLSVWLEWLDAPNTITAGTNLSLDVTLVATAEPQQLAITGDLDANGFVDILDLNIVLANWNTDGLADPRADTDGNGLIDIIDLNVVLTNWNQGTPPATGSAIPEPATLGLVALGGIAMLKRRRS